MELGTASIRLEADGVHVVPSRWQRLRGATPQHLPYAALVGVSMKEPHGRTAGQLMLRGRRSSDTVSVRFGSGQVADMHHVAGQLWERIREAREREGPPGSED
jgi:hypothetical protein